MDQSQCPECEYWLSYTATQLTQPPQEKGVREFQVIGKEDGDQQILQTQASIDAGEK
jgi:hypothetical protein